jgi:beta-glucanase (GH16 family)
MPGWLRAGDGPATAPRRENRKEKAMKRPIRAVILGAAALALALGGCNKDETPPLVWTLVFEDDFEGAAGELPDPTKWTFDVGVDWGNAQLEFDTARPENVSLDGNGNLAIVAREEDYTGTVNGNQHTRDYTSGRIKTQGLFAYTRGRFEARIKQPVGKGLWPAFWMLGNDISQKGWPACGEIDIMEYRGQEPSLTTCAIHGPGYSGNGSLHSSLSTGTNLNEDFHVYGIDWDEDGITWMFDGEAFASFGPDDIPPGARWVYDHPFFILLNVAVGGHYVGAPDSTTVFPQTMLVDWVRVHAWKIAADGG